jgi:hypothetical protein
MWDLSLILIRKSAVREDQNKSCCEVLLDVEGRYVHQGRTLSPKEYSGSCRFTGCALASRLHQQISITVHRDAPFPKTDVGVDHP